MSLLKGTKTASEWIREGKSCNDHAEALRCFCQALNLEPQNRNAIFNKGVACLNLGRCNEALKCFEFLSEQDPENVTLLEMKGRAYQEMHGYRKAVMVFSEALEIVGAKADEDIDLKRKLKRLINRSV
ncbi:tetratricopeptide (TPR) repeat protein [Methanohalophilus levihalophilus]|uniref:tetratricopeptide repeat protein n=1 Tax=Methanohalophilus levihalophilus TaxID=1431282 RepID=UPI001AE358B3|nr:hypothetical protein [Methanohalophilus levihalophilus]MBP2029454.1 tetratricopeptide (TPR) repeat protein [Methanohalophilus levihalophilus]